MNIVLQRCNRTLILFVDFLDCHNMQCYVIQDQMKLLTQVLRKWMFCFWMDVYFETVV